MFQHTPTNKLLYNRDVPKFKQEVKSYYKHIRDLSPITNAEFKDFLRGESKVKSVLAQIKIRYSSRKFEHILIEDMNAGAILGFSLSSLRQNVCA